MTENLTTIFNTLATIMTAFGVTHHCDTLPHGEASDNRNYDNCMTNPGHENFVTVDKFKMEHLPSEGQTQKNMDKIRNAIDRTVKVKVSWTSTDRPDKFVSSDTPYPFSNLKGSRFNRCGTGFIKCCSDKVTENVCPCALCKESQDPQMKYWTVIVTTATHIIFDSKEAQNAEFELFYDSENEEGVRRLYGIDVIFNEIHRKLHSDHCCVKCVTHELDLGDRVRRLCGIKFNWITKQVSSSYGIMISHPHGISKRISLGKIFHENIITNKKDLNFRLKEGKLCFIPTSCDDQEGAQHCEKVCSNPPSNDASLPTQITSSLQSIGESITEKDSGKNPQKTGKVKPNYDFCDYFQREKNRDIYKLRFDMNVIFPLSAHYHIRRSIQTDLFRWWSFTEDTKFNLPDTGVEVSVPRETLFHFSPKDIYNCCCSYLTYDMASCPGSSGAKIISLGSNYNAVILGYNNYGKSKKHNMSGLSYRCSCGDDDDSDDQVCNS